MPVAKIVSGGQSGIDLAALDAALELGIPTGGWMPKGFMTEGGPKPEYAQKYGMQEMPTTSYPARTRKNVSEANLVLILHTKNTDLTGGTRLTATLALEMQVPLGHACVNGPFDPMYREFIAFHELNGNPLHLMVAGPRESKSPGIYKKARAFLLELLKEKS